MPSLFLYLDIILLWSWVLVYQLNFDLPILIVLLMMSIRLKWNLLHLYGNHPYYYPLPLRNRKWSLDIVVVIFHNKFIEVKMSFSEYLRPSHEFFFLIIIELAINFSFTFTHNDIAKRHFLKVKIRFRNFSR